jgi:hypothetical protein
MYKSRVTFQKGEIMTNPNPSHPQAIAAAERAKQRDLERRAERATVAEARDFGVRFVEVTPQQLDFTAPDAPVKAGRMTIAYMERGRNIIEIATSICHRADEFNKVTGRALAGLALMNGQSILLRKPTFRRPVPTKQWLISTFTFVADHA